MLRECIEPIQRKNLRRCWVRKLLEIIELFGNKAFLALILISSIALFLVLREFYCWYFKLNKIVDVLEKNQQIQKETNKLLEELNNKL